MTYYRADLALVHHLGFGFHADRCAPGIVALLEPVRARGGVVLELGCGSGRLTGHLVAAGHRVIATDASPAMLELARQHAPGAEEMRVLRLPDDPLPAADAVVSVGHVLSYLDSAGDVERALVAAAGALRPGGVLAVDLCDFDYAEAHWDPSNTGRSGDDWAIITERSRPSPDRFVRDITTFVRNDDGVTWRRDHERHENVLVDTSQVPALLATHGLEATVGHAFGDEELPQGLHTIVGHHL